MIQSWRVVRSRGWRKRERQVRENRAAVLMRYAPSGVRIRAVACPICGDLNYDRRILVPDSAIAIAKELQECAERTVNMHDVLDTGDRVRWFRVPHRESLNHAKMSTALFTRMLVERIGQV
jgi:hypothetical protein